HRHKVLSGHGFAGLSEPDLKPMCSSHLRKVVRHHRHFIYGTKHADLICWYPYPVTISSGGGDDHVYSGKKNDVIRGGPGNDVLLAGWGNDVVRGGGGDDYVEGDKGNNHIYGGPGDDGLIGGRGNDVLVDWGKHSGGDRFLGGK